MPATITAIAHYYPEDKLTNKHFESYLDTSDEWIKTRTGINERRIMKNGATSDMIVPAALKCIENAGIDKQEIDCIIVATVTPDHMYPSTAAVVQHKLGIKNVWGFDISAACSGFLFALKTAASLVESGAAKKVLLCGADKMSSILNMNDRNTAILFGDAAGVCLIEKSNDDNYGILDSILHIDGIGGQYLNQKAGGSAHPATKETVENMEHTVYQDGKTVFKYAVKGMADVSKEIMDKNNLTSEDISFLVPHQANLRIISATAERMGVGMDKVMVNIEKYGNTTAATIPLCISEWLEAGKIKKGDNLILSSFGAGFTWGSIYVKWNMNK
ncbi:MAG: 3-oxoacyl-ACP synthase [Ignavibacteriae bacterium HGW-Ignavibacteriae-4]|jgi:3-oxoacyl-[acyl-carrier-protein] synthase-3|nr:MAG: 3-oxoacyl-ACP synthase [Ignavibacteriae bacterium HGW-Ignavibacteriae-4]